MIQGVDVQLAAATDAAEIAAMSREYIEHGLPWSWQAGRVARAIADPQTNVAVVRSRESLIAFGIMSYLDDDAHLLLFAVRRVRQRHGVGSAVLLWLEAAARAAGAERIRVEARRDNIAARNFYNQHGYHELTIKQGMYSGLLDGIRMVKWLRGNAGVNDEQAPAKF
jgi:ribosomal protein S18 acetylase RimI-like enzyme